MNLDDNSTPRQQLSVELANILGYGMIPFYVYFLLKAFLLPSGPLPKIGVVLVTGYLVVWLLIALVWLVMSHFPAIQFTLRELFVTVLTLQIPLSLLLVAQSGLLRGLGLLGLCIWVASLFVYYSLKKVRSR